MWNKQLQNEFDAMMRAMAREQYEGRLESPARHGLIRKLTDDRTAAWVAADKLRDRLEAAYSLQGWLFTFAILGWTFVVGLAVALVVRG